MSAGAGFGLPADMRRCDLCSVALWTWWETPDGRAQWCTECALVVTERRDANLRAAAGAGRRFR